VALAVTELRSPVSGISHRCSTAAREYRRLMALGSAQLSLSPGYSGAERHPDDPRVPGHCIAVRTTRYGCADKETGRWSGSIRSCIDYPNNSGQETPYWFKD
jgi:hypothetical protein